VVFAVISNPNTSISKIIYLIRPFDERAEIEFSATKMPKMNIAKHYRNK